MNLFEMNLNDRVGVRLNELGLRRFREEPDRMNAAMEPPAMFPVEPALDAEGRYITVPWNLMYVFGDLMGNGRPSPFIDNRIEIPSQE